ncbi:MAG: hypothetical protein RI897_4397 [Verrucomicrobiota bacterium]|jgi:flagellar hook protein FlgE
MLRSLTSAISGLQNFQQQMDVIGNNIANVNTPGFKAGHVDFADSFSQTLRQSSSGDATSSGVSAMQVGLGVKTSAISNDWSTGSMTMTGVPTHLAIQDQSGNDFFVVRDPVSNETFVTRVGNFHLSEAGYLETNSGLRVQGYNDSGLTTVGDIRIDAGDKPSGVDPDAQLKSYSIDNEGKVKVVLSNGEDYDRGQVLLQRFTKPDGLAKEGNNLYSGMAAAGPAFTTLQAPGSNGLGQLEANMLELSNVDIAEEFATMITAQRAFQATSRVITTSDEMLQELVNLKR